MKKIFEEAKKNNSVLTIITRGRGLFLGMRLKYNVNESKKIIKINDEYVTLKTSFDKIIFIPYTSIFVIELYK